MMDMHGTMRNSQGLQLLQCLANESGHAFFQTVSALKVCCH